MSTVFLTGGCGGIGAATAEAFTDAGWNVIASDHPDAILAAGADDVLPLDVTDEEAVDHAVTAAYADGANAFVSIAGVLCKSPVHATTVEDFTQTFAVNVGGPFLMCRAVARAVQSQGAHRNTSITTVASNAAVVPRHSVATYAASKAAASMYTRSAGLELGPLGVRCNVVNPGSTVTPMLTAMFDPERDSLTADEERSLIEGNPAVFKGGIVNGKVGTPRNVADAVLFLASEAASQITLAQLNVDGGASLQ